MFLFDNNGDFIICTGDSNICVLNVTSKAVQMYLDVIKSFGFVNWNSH